MEKNAGETKRKNGKTISFSILNNLNIKTRTRLYQVTILHIKLLLWIDLSKYFVSGFGVLDIQVFVKK